MAAAAAAAATAEVAAKIIFGHKTTSAAFSSHPHMQMSNKSRSMRLNVDLSHITSNGVSVLYIDHYYDASG